MEIIFYTSQILNGLCYLHSSQILHLDLEPANIVLTENKKTAKICDMDSSQKKWCDESKKSDVSAYLGTLCFTSPEYLKHDRDAKPIGRATDIWSLGCVVLFMLGKGDFHIIDQDGKRFSVEDYLQELYFSTLVMNGRIPETSVKMSANMRSFVSSCLKLEPDERTSGANLLNHQVFNFHNSQGPQRVSRRQFVSLRTGVTRTLNLLEILDLDVHKVSNDEDPKSAVCVLKRIPIRPRVSAIEDTQDERDKIIRKYAALMELEHENVVKYFDYGRNEPHMEMERMACWYSLQEYHSGKSFNLELFPVFRHLLCELQSNLQFINILQSVSSFL